MGTALQSTIDREDNATLKKIIREADKDRSGKTRRRLDLALRKVINEILFKGQEIAPVRNTVTAAIARQVKIDVMPKFAGISSGPKKTKRKRRPSRRGR